MARCADPHDGQPGSLGRVPLATIRGDEWDAEIRRGLELDSGRDVQRIESPEPLPSGQLLCASEDSPSCVHEFPVRPITLQAPHELRMVRLGQVPGLPAPAEGGQGLDRQDSG